MKKNVLLRSTILLLFIYFFLSFPSLATTSGDFNSDGKVDFEDLMIFALAYGSTPSDDNWNPSCDLLYDSVIDFEDLMLFAMNYGETSAKGSITGKIMVPEQSKRKDITGWVPLPNATVTLTDSTGQTHTGEYKGSNLYY
jgi:hypothetical protein